MKNVEQLLQDQRQIVGAPLAINNMLNPSVDSVNEETVYKVDNAIVAEIKRQQAIRSGEIIEMESGDEDISDNKPKLSTAELTGLCEQLEAGCIARVNTNSSFHVIHNLRRFRGALQHKEIQDVKQATLDTLWNMK